MPKRRNFDKSVTTAVVVVTEGRQLLNVFRSCGLTSNIIELPRLALSNLPTFALSNLPVDSWSAVLKFLPKRQNFDISVPWRPLLQSRQLLNVFRSCGRVGTTERFRSFSDTFTQRFQSKAPFFSWCWTTTCVQQNEQSYSLMVGDCPFPQWARPFARKKLKCSLFKT